MNRLAIFDCDGTLVDSNDLHVKAWERAFDRYGHAITTDAIREQIGKGGDQLVPSLAERWELADLNGDGAADLTPLFGLPKRRVREIGRHLDCPEDLVTKVPTADLESDKPLLADEVALGVTYEAIDDYLEGKDVSDEDEATILGWYRRTAHKRALPVTPDGYLRDR